MIGDNNAPALTPLNFSDSFEAVASEFIGRESLFQLVDDWIEKPSGQLLLISGWPGTGKTSFAARLATVRSDVAAAHFCSFEDSRTVRPTTAIRFIAANLSATLQKNGERLANTVNPAHRGCRRKHNATWTVRLAF